MMKELLTTFEIARLCKVDITTVINWVDTGKLPAYKTPGGHRRIRRSDFLAFLKTYDLPVPRGSSGSCTILLVMGKNDPQKRIVRNIVQDINREEDLCEAEDGFAAGKLIAEKQPALVILGSHIHGIDSPHVCQLIRSDRRLKDTRILIIGASKKTVPHHPHMSRSECHIIKPFTKEELSRCIVKLLDL